MFEYKEQKDERKWEGMIKVINDKTAKRYPIFNRIF